MSRTLGFFLGSAAVFAMLVYVLGQPVSFAPPADRQLQDRTGQSTFARSEVETIQQPAVARQPVAEAQSPESTPDTSIDRPPVQPVAAAPVPQPVELDPVDVSLASAVEDVAADDAVAVHSPDSVGPPKPGADAETEWFPLWDPFHSELSANAFARRLERLTGLDYRVIKTDPASYRVAVGYSSEEQRNANVTAIEEATGLSISGGSR